ncbi:MAG: RnfABCDGE type electron transport complex subunit D, partial [Candidatus Omnitrophica bacterium]|nr:RnfABCDGE type electron transport complex subunit D [Candidatus Omnitrophota bacterium]
MMEESPHIVSIGPHLKDKDSTKTIMWLVTLSLIPSGIAGVVIFGVKSLFIIIASILSAAITETVVLALRKKDLKAVYDGSAILTGLLLAYNLPPQVPIWMPIAGSFFAIAIGKQVFGGLGHNIFNPA